MSTRYKSKRGVYIIAEVGINHNGSMDEAKALIKGAAEAGADAVKTQLRDLDTLYTKQVLADSRKAEQGTQYLLAELRKAHLSYDQMKELFAYAKGFDIDFFATPFDVKSAEFLNGIGMGIFKVGSPDFTNRPLLEKITEFNRPIILSTGMSEEAEIKQVVGYLKSRGADFALLHCNSTYPASFSDLNLRYIPVLRQITGVRVGYSGHEQGFVPTVAALGLGADIIERHITRDRNQSGPDHRSSLNFTEFKEMVDAVRVAEESLGKAEKVYNQGEKNNRISLAKSLVAAKDLPVGHRLTAGDLSSKTPAKGVSPMDLDYFLGKTLNRALSADDYIFRQDVVDGPAAKPRTYSIPKKWGIVGRLNDFQEFLDVKPGLVEIHLTWRDLEDYRLPAGTFEQDLVVHAPEYYKDQLIDFTSSDAAITELSREMLKRTLNLARELAPKFKGMKDPRGPRVVVHPGGHFAQPTESNKTDQYKLLKKNLEAMPSEGTQLLVENMPPLPWYFGGQWYNTVFMDAGEIAQFAKDMGWGICFDTSHAGLYCHHAGISMQDFTKRILDHIAYLHVSDSKGSTGEGVQIGQGDLDFASLFAIMNRLDTGFIPEIWQGHLNRGQGFREALEILEGILAKVSSRSCS
ncbi:MAG: N-acetylneuraminate synthase family protein [Bacteriovoracia bacterium]